MVLSFEACALPDRVCLRDFRFGSAVGSSWRGGKGREEDEEEEEEEHWVDGCNNSGHGAWYER